MINPYPSLLSDYTKQIEIFFLFCMLIFPIVLKETISFRLIRNLLLPLFKIDSICSSGLWLSCGNPFLSTGRHLSSPTSGRTSGTRSAVSSATFRVHRHGQQWPNSTVFPGAPASEFRLSVYPSTTNSDIAQWRSTDG